MSDEEDRHLETRNWTQKEAYCLEREGKEAYCLERERKGACCLEREEKEVGIRRKRLEESRMETKAFMEAQQVWEEDSCVTTEYDEMDARKYEVTYAMPEN